MKRKLLIVGIQMKMGGTEKSFLTFLSLLSQSEWDVTLLLANDGGELFSLLPPWVKVEFIPGGEVFFLNKRNTPKMLFKTKPSSVLKAVGAFTKSFFIKTGDKNSFSDKSKFAFNRLWLSLMSELPAFAGEYDTALAYWGDRTMFYLADKVNAKNKIAWLHFDYNNPVRENTIYEKYFSVMDKTVTVTAENVELLKSIFPGISSRFCLFENRVSAARLSALAKSGERLPSHDKLKLLSVGRLCEAKGFDIAIAAAKLLLENKIDFRWYIVGNGELEKKLKRLSKINGTEENIVFVGMKTNPYGYMDSCDIYVQPSRYEARPLTVDEALALGCAVIVTDYPAAEAQVTGAAPAEVTMAEPEALCKAIISMNKRQKEISNQYKSSASETPLCDESKKYLNDLLCYNRK